MKNHNDVIGIGLESSCDETAVAIVNNGKVILSNCVYSQIHLHRDFSGVVPEIASRAHLEVINTLIDRALKEAGIGFNDLHYVSATNRPGLIGSLLIALQSAKAISYTMGIPLITVNHLEAHLYAPVLEGNEIFYPFLGLLVSGGNTVLYNVKGLGEMEILGKTQDDAVGEAFDKISKYLGLGYPGGPVIEKLALKAKDKKNLFPKILADSPDDYRFSYSGLKTAVINFIKKNPGYNRSEIVYSFQERALEILSRRVFAASKETGIKKIIIAGGVAANKRLREMFNEQKSDDHIIVMPSPGLCTDNAAMVACLGAEYFLNGHYDKLTADVFARV